MLEAINCNFEPYVISEAPQALGHNGEKPRLLLRHDIDVDLNKALQMARIENEFGVRATYMVMLNSPFYHVEDPPSRSILRRLISMGHEVALPLDFDNAEERINSPEPGSLEPKVRSACQRLEAVIDLGVHSISFHRPLPQFLRGPLIVASRVNAYSRELMAWYLSDSKGNWREGEPLPKLLNPDRPLLQLLIHPIWWGEEHMSAEDRLQAFFEVVTQGHSPETVQALDASLAGHLGIRRSGIIKAQERTE